MSAMPNSSSSSNTTAILCTIYAHLMHLIFIFIISFSTFFLHRRWMWFSVRIGKKWWWKAQRKWVQCSKRASNLCESSIRNETEPERMWAWLKLTDSKDDTSESTTVRFLDKWNEQANMCARSHLIQTKRLLQTHCNFHIHFKIIHHSFYFVLFFSRSVSWFLLLACQCLCLHVNELNRFICNLSLSAFVHWIWCASGAV